MHIGILQTGHAPEELRMAQGEYTDMFQRLLGGRSFEFTTWDVVDGAFPPDVHAAEGWLITGSKHGVYEDHPWIPLLEDHIRAAYEAGVPVVGICFGHQIVAQALGGRVEKFGGGWSVGRHRYDWQGQEVALNTWHQDQVVERPDGAETVASSPFCAHAALVYGDRAFTVQAHPEFDAHTIDTLIRTRGAGSVPEELLAQAEARLDDPTHNPLIADRIAAFLREARHG